MGAVDQDLFERCQIAVRADQRIEQLFGAGLRQWIEPQAAIILFVNPSVAVAGPIVDQQKNPPEWQTFDQAVEKRLGLTIDPMQILKPQKQRLTLADA